MRHGPHLVLRVLITTHPALTRWASSMPPLRWLRVLIDHAPTLTRWAKVCRSSGARTRPSGPRRGGRARAFRCWPESTMPSGVPSFAGFAPPPIPLRVVGDERGGLSHPFSNFYFYFQIRGGAEACRGEIFQGAKRVSISAGVRAAAGGREVRRKSGAGRSPLARVAFLQEETSCGRIAAEARAGHDVVEALHGSGSAAETIKAGARVRDRERLLRRRPVFRNPWFQGSMHRLPASAEGAISARAERADLSRAGACSTGGRSCCVRASVRAQLNEPAHRLAQRSPWKYPVIVLLTKRKVQVGASL